MPSTLAQALGQKIKSARKRCGISQETLAKAIGVTKSTISKYELGLRELSFDQLCQIADALDVNFLQLIPHSMQDAFLAGIATAVHTERYLAALSSGAEDEAADAEEDAVLLFKCFNHLNKHGQKEAINKLMELCHQREYCSTQPQD